MRQSKLATHTAKTRGRCRRGCPVWPACTPTLAPTSNRSALCRLESSSRTLWLHPWQTLLHRRLPSPERVRSFAPIISVRPSLSLERKPSPGRPFAQTVRLEPFLGCPSLVARRHTFLRTLRNSNKPPIPRRGGIDVAFDRSSAWIEVLPGRILAVVPTRLNQPRAAPSHPFAEAPKIALVPTRQSARG